MKTSNLYYKFCYNKKMSDDVIFLLMSSEKTCYGNTLLTQSARRVTFMLLLCCITLSLSLFLFNLMSDHIIFSTVMSVLVSSDFSYNHDA